MAYFVAFLVVICCCQVFVESKWNCQNCGINFKAIGCYKDHFTRPLPEEILNERDVTSKVYGGQKIRWHDWDNYMAGFACRCAEAAKAKGYSVFALQFYGECWSGPDAESYKISGKANADECIGPNYKKCGPYDRNCVGKKEINFVYQIVPECELPLESIGCYADDHKDGSRPLPTYALTDRDPTMSQIYSGKSIDWRNWDAYMPELACRCAKKAKAMGKSTFGLQFYGECWVADASDVKYLKDGSSNKCIDKCYEKCHSYDKFCSGKNFANYVYRLADSPCEWKTTPVGCYKEETSSRALGTIILDEIQPSASAAYRGNIFNETHWDAEFPTLLCRCAREAKKHGFSNFGVHNKATCWGSSDSEAYKKHGVSSGCKCSGSSADCAGGKAGGKESMFVYAVSPAESAKRKRNFKPSLDDLFNV